MSKRDLLDQHYSEIEKICAFTKNDFMLKHVNEILTMDDFMPEDCEYCKEIQKLIDIWDK